MIGLDTNVLVRYIMQDDAKQARRAAALIESLTPERPGFISVVALVELVWVLESVYTLTRAQIAQALQTLLSIEVWTIERAIAVSSALRGYANGKVDFADRVIERVGASAGCECTMTFDRDAAKAGGMVLIRE